MFDQDIIMTLKNQKPIPEDKARLPLNIDKKRKFKRGARSFTVGGWSAGRATIATRQSLSDRIMEAARSVRAVTIVDVRPGRANIHIRLAWWTVFGLGLVHRLARRRVRHVILDSKTVQADVQLKRVGIFV